MIDRCTEPKGCGITAEFIAGAIGVVSPRDNSGHPKRYPTMKSVFPDETQCAWCLEEKTGLTKDHVVPRSIGGTLEYALPSCTKCQGILSKAERTLARKSFLAIHA